MSTTPPRPSDAGVSLVVVLVFTTAVFTIVASVLSWTSTALRTTDTYGTIQASSDTDAAMKAAVNQIRNSTFDNDTNFLKPQSCDLDPSSSATALTSPGSNGSGVVTVTCTGAAGTGVDGGFVPAGLGGSNLPKYALLTKGAGGISFTGSNGTVREKGGVFSTAGITLKPGHFQSLDGSSVGAAGSCSGAVTDANDLNSKPCTSGAAGGIDPATYTQPAVPSPLVPQAMPECKGAGKSTSFAPGYYDDAQQLTKFMTSCGSQTFLFPSTSSDGTTPTVYYFDFRNGQPGVTPGSTTWDIGTKSVIAGTPSGWWTSTGEWDQSGAAWSQSAPSTTGACTPPQYKAANGGVEFVFGGSSRLSVNDGYFEICGQYSSAEPPVALYGLKSTSGNDPSSSTFAAAPDGATGSVTGDFGPNSYKNVSWPADTTKVASANMNGKSTSTLTLGKFTPTPSIPVGSMLESAVLLIDHKEANTSGSLDTFTVSLEPTGSSASSAMTIPPNVSSSYRTDTVSLTGDDLDNLATAIHSGSVGDFAATISASLQNKKDHVKVDIDGVQLKLTYTAPYLKAQDGSTMVSIDGPKTRFLVQGTIYAPTAALDLRMLNTHDATDYGFRWGIVAGSVSGQFNGSNQNAEPVFQLPTSSVGWTATEVYFTAKSSSTTVLTARVRYTDSIAGKPSLGARGVKILSWTTQR